MAASDKVASGIPQRLFRRSKSRAAVAILGSRFPKPHAGTTARMDSTDNRRMACRHP
jgi:hypothetical protein